MGRDLDYPQRSRCRACRKYLDFTVILMKYCSAKCAGISEQFSTVEDLPRKCKVRVSGRWQRKAAYFTPAEAQAVIGRQRKTWYLCEPPDGCGMYHLAKQRQSTADEKPEGIA
jgi:hypothetical protein